MYETTFHEDGTITYWSVYQQQWICHAVNVPDEEYAAMSPSEREKVSTHLSANKVYSIIVDGKPVLEGLLPLAAEWALDNWKEQYPSSIVEIIKAK